jgi:hypothetical protein
MKTTKLSQLFVLGVTLIAFTVSANASEDGKTLPGALCQPGSHTQAIVRIAGSMFNVSASPQVWTCPIVRDVVGAAAIEFARITVVDNNNDSGAVVFCALVSSTSTGTVHDSDIQDTSGEAGTVALDYGSGDVKALSGVNGGYYYFQCSIPGTDNNGQQSGVISYQVNENDGED